MVDSLLRIVTTIYRRPVLCSALRDRPRAALADLGFAHADAPDHLPLPPERISIRIDASTLLGIREWWHIDPDADLARPEVVLLLAGAKPLVLVHGPEAGLTGLAAWMRARGFYALLSPYQFQPKRDTSKAGYANRMEAPGPATAGSGAWRGLLVSEDPEITTLGWLCLLFGWERFLGRLLGYPDCCCQAYDARWDAARREHGGDVALGALFAEPSPFVGRFGWETNVFARYFGYEVVQHFPCRFDCAPTVALARRNLAILSRYAPHATAALRDALAAPVIATRAGGVYLLPGGRCRPKGLGMRLRYDPARALFGVSDEIGRCLETHDMLELEDDGCWRVGAKRLVARVIDFSDAEMIEGRAT